MPVIRLLVLLICTLGDAQASDCYELFSIRESGLSVPVVHGFAARSYSHQMTFEALGISPSAIGHGKRVLVVGDGQHGISHQLQRLGNHVVAVDPLYSNATIAAQVNRKNPHVEWLPGGVEKLPFESFEFDVVIVHQVYNNLPPRIRRAALNEITRVLKSRTGIAYFAQFVKPGEGASLLQAFRTLVDHRVFVGGTEKVMRVEYHESSSVGEGNGRFEAVSQIQIHRL
jgi:ubiquinone/menaquinone biosynthesis C-methylase UbiE